MATEGKIIDLDAFRPHIVIPCDDGVHVVPKALIEQWISGDSKPSDSMVRQIITEWWRLIGQT